MFSVIPQMSSKPSVSMATLRSVTQNLNCPLCMDTFVEATLLNCGHTFCRKCLSQYDDFHPEWDDMLCPLCREPTPLTDQRVGGLSTNVSLNSLVGDINRISMNLSKMSESGPKCNLCRPMSMRFDAESKLSEPPIAVSFCYECEGYMCE